MKKIIVTGALALFTAGLFAQSTNSSGLSSKKGEMYLPEAGDWSIAFDATPWLKYFGGFLSSGGATPPTANYITSNNTITGKYFVDEHTAYRGVLRIGIASQGQANTIDNSSKITGTPPYVPSTVVDNASTSSHFIGLGAGMEKRKGHTRIQGYYGAELFFWLTGSTTTFTYGNSYDPNNNPNPLYTNSWGPTTSTTNLAAGPAYSGRPTSMTAGSTFGISVQGFIGFEYFFMPKVSIGAEYTWGINFWSTGQGSTTFEDINATGANPVSQSDTQIHPGTGTNGFSIDSGINSIFGNAESAFNSASSASLNINFHF